MKKEKTSYEILWLNIAENKYSTYIKRKRHPPKKKPKERISQNES